MRIERFQLLVENLEKLTLRQREFLEKYLGTTGQTQLVNTLIESRTSVTLACPKCGHDQIPPQGQMVGICTAND